MTRPKLLLAAALACCGVVGMWAQSSPSDLAARMKTPLQTPEEVSLRLRQYLLGRIPSLKAPADARAWSDQAAGLRAKALEILYHGWPKEWVDAAPRFEEVGSPVAGAGYRMRKFRYEVVPGMMSTAILYEPDSPRTPMPAIVNVNGHVGAPGKAVEYKQKRCINQARMGILALNLEWLGCGELFAPDNAHWFGGHCDLAGANGAGLFYLAMRRGLDYVASRNDVDSKRIGVTGLSGGGWQTIMLSALDPRVTASVPVAGYMSLVSRIQKYGEAGDIEQSPTDLLGVADYAQLTAMRAPRPTLLQYNAEDDCCFRAPLVKGRVFHDVRPFYELYGAASKLQWHENMDPGDHNYQLDNRVAAYRFFAEQFGLKPVTAESPAGDEVKSYDELKVGLPADNLTILGVARKLAARNERNTAASPQERRKLLADVVRLRPVQVRHAWPLANTKHQGVETVSYLFEFSDGLSASGFWAKAIAAPDHGPVSLLLNDKGRQAAAVQAADRVNREERVLVLDTLFRGDAASHADFAFAEFLSTVGERPLGIEAAQVLAVRKWLADQAGSRATTRLHMFGIRSQMVGQIAAALEPGAFSEAIVESGAASIGHFLEGPVKFLDAPDMFCLDLYKHFDFDSLTALSGPTKVLMAPH
jgi:dienelactone hydrolase